MCISWCRTARHGLPRQHILPVGAGPTDRTGRPAIRRDRRM